ncbi:hypothetical protein ANO11243_063840 [Dothideomycetidae sp. 11243]|nr:hypothetical protein ANO11243_063840 [fungal sp. No.11243]
MGIKRTHATMASNDAHDDGADSRADAATRGMHPDRAAELLVDADELEVAAKHAKRAEGRVKRLPAGVRIERERELKGLEEKVREVERRKKRSDCITRWHRVRFFERRKAERRLKKVAKEGGDEHGATVDLNYALYFPLEREYVSLWPRKKEGDEQAEERMGDRDMWLLVEKCMADGTLDDLREGKVEGCGVENGETDLAESHAVDKKTKAKTKKTTQKAEDSDSDDGGFFEK